MFQFDNIKKISLFIAIGLLVPFGVHAEDISEADRARLQEQISILVLEVERLTKLLQAHSSGVSSYEPLSQNEMRDIIADGVMWFKNAQEENGHFKYEYAPYEDLYLDDDNIVRQAGGLYALGELAQHDTQNILNLKDTLISSISYFESLTRDGNANGRAFKCIVNSSLNELCQLGATSLALTGVLGAVDRYPELNTEYADLIQSYGDYILAMKKEGAGFRNVYVDGSPLTDRESSFSNGEAVLALVRWYQYEANEEVKQVLNDAFTYFESDAVPFDFPLYLWVTATLKDMYALWGDPRYAAYVKEYTDWRVNGYRYRKGSTHNTCAYIEGVLSAQSILKETVSESEANQYQREIDFWLRKLSDLQIGEDDVKKIITDEEGSRFGVIQNKTQAFGGFLTGKTKLTQRIDYTQHCLTSYLQQLVDIEKASL